MGDYEIKLGTMLSKYEIIEEKLSRQTNENLRLIEINKNWHIEQANMIKMHETQLAEQKLKMGEISRRYEETNNQNTITKIRKNLAANEMTQKNEQLQIQISNIKASNVVLEHSNRELKEKVKQQQSDQSELFDTLGKLRSKIASLINQNDKLSTEYSTQAKANSELVENNK